MRFVRATLLSALAAALLLAPAAAHAQAVTAISATAVDAGNGPVTGTLCFTAVNTYNNPISVTKTGGGLFIAGRPFCQTLTAGALVGSLTVPNPVTDSAPGHAYDITVYDNASGLKTDVGQGPVFGIGGASWSLDSYIPPSTVPTTQAFTFTTGSGTAPTSCIAPALDVRVNAGVATFSVCSAGVFVQSSSSGGGGSALPHITAILKGDGAGGAVAAGAGTDYVIPTGSVATATALAATPTPCTAGQAPRGVLANGNSTGCFTPAGAPGPPGPPASFLGTWNSGTAYTTGQAVSYTDGSSYVALAASTNVAPPSSLGTDWALLAAAGVAGGLSTEQVGQVIAAQNSVRNLFDPSKVTAGQRLLIGGGTQADAGSSLSGFVPVAGVDNITLNKYLAQPNSYFGYELYDIAFNPITGGQLGAPPATLGIPSNAAYFRAGFATTDIPSLMIVNGTTLPGAYVGFGSVDPASVASQISTAVAASAASQASQITAAVTAAGVLAAATQPVQSNLFDPNKATEGCLLLSGNGAPQSGNTGNFCTGFIPVAGAGSITVNLIPAGNSQYFGYSFYDQAQNFISGGDMTAQPQTLTLPAGAVFWRAGYVDSTLHTVMVVAGGTLPSAYVPFGYNNPAQEAANIAAAVQSAKVGNGKHIGIFGDSICQLYGSQWLPTIAARSGATVTFQDCHAGRNTVNAFENYSTGAAAPNGTSTGTSGNGSLTSGTTLAADLATVDLMLVELGTNDCAYTEGGSPPGLGSPGDAPSTTTTLAAAQGYVIQTLQAAKPTMHILWISPYNYQPNNGHGGCTLAADQRALNAALLPAVHYYGVPVADAFDESTIGPYTWSTYLPDGLHVISASGSVAYGSYIAGKVNQYF